MPPESKVAAVEGEKILIVDDDQDLVTLDLIDAAGDDAPEPHRHGLIELLRWHVQHRRDRRHGVVAGFAIICPGSLHRQQHHHRER